MTRLPLRARLTLVFALAMAVVLAGMGAFLYVRVGDSLRNAVDDTLDLRAAALVEDVEGGVIETALPGGEEEFAQVLDRDGEVVAATPGLDAALLSADRRAAAAEGPVRADAEVSPPGENELEPVRLLAVPAGDGVAILGASLEDRADALDGLLAQLLIGGPIALLLASAAGYVLAGAALRPVAAMRRRAGEISAETSGERLPLPRARDEIHRLGTTLNAMLDRLDAGLRRERRFVADASHELRTPLALLQTELDLALRKPRTSEELDGALRSAADEVDRLARLAEDLLLLASSEEGRVRITATRFRASELLQGVARRFETRARAAGTSVEAERVSVGEVEGDRLRLEQALGNLVDNALRHGGGPVHLEAHGDGDEVLLCVRDAGEGFPPEFLGRAFERFSRAEAARTSAGAGLGLAIVAAIAEAHGGSAEAGNAEGGGAVVSLRLPAVRPGERPA